MQSFEWSQAIKTCSVRDQMRAIVARLCIKSLSKVSPFDSHKQICTPQPDCRGEFRASVFSDTLISRHDTEYSSKHCKQWLYSSGTVKNLKPYRPGKTNGAELSESDREEYIAEDWSDYSLLFFILLSSFVREKSTQMVVFLTLPRLGSWPEKSGGVMYSIFVFVWAAVQSILKFTHRYCLK